MTLEEIKEAVEVIKAYRQMLTDSVSNQIDGDIKAFDVAVEAMERESCGDYVSRQAVLNKIIKFSVTDGRSVSVTGLWAEVNDLPPVNPQRTGHCEDCKHFRKLPYHTDTLGKCVQHTGFCPKGDWYCGDYEPQESEVQE